MAKKNKPVLSNWDKDCIANASKRFKVLVDNLELARQFKVGDYLVAWLRGDSEDNMEFNWEKLLDSYGAPVKYIVVHTTEQGLAFMKRLRGDGSVMDSLEASNHDWMRFEIDPDYADSLILQAEYDPGAMQKARKAAWKEVTEYNKAHKISTKEIKDIVAHFKIVQVGDTLWTSAVSHYTVTATRTLLRAECKKLNIDIGYYVKGPQITVLTLVDKKGTSKDVIASHFLCKALYKARPRSYKELSI